MRFEPRHLQQTCADYVQTGLIALNWAGENGPPYNFGVVAPIEFWEVEPDDTRNPPEQGVVATLIDDTGPDDPQELGADSNAGLYLVQYSLFVHCRAAKGSVSLSIASDVKDLLTNGVIPLYDYSEDPSTSVDGAYIEFETVVIDRAPVSYGAIEFRRPWRVVTAMANLYKVAVPVEGP